MKLLKILLISMLGVLVIPEAIALKIHEITTPKGIKAWFVEEHNLPIVSLSFAFEGGSAHVPIGQEGVSLFATQLLLEGAGNLMAHDFKEKLEELGVQMSFSSDVDYVYGSFRTILDHRVDALKLLKLALTKPRLDTSSIELVRDQLITNARNLQRSPSYIVTRKMKETLFKDHPYSRPEEGTPQSLKSIQKENITTFLHRVFRRDGLKVVVCGHMNLEDVITMLDDVFGDFPAPTDIKKLTQITAQFPGTLIIQKEPFPQSVSLFLQKGLAATDPNYTKLALLSYIIGGSPTSRLWQEVREERGLSYYIGTTVNHDRYFQYFGGSMGSENARMKDAVSIVRNEWQKAAQGDLKPQELTHAKEALVESFALAFADTLSTTSALLSYFIEGFNPQYVYDREKRIRSVSLNELNMFAKSFLEPKQLTFFIVGEPQGLEEAKDGNGK